MRGIKGILGGAVLLVGATVAFFAIDNTTQAKDCSSNAVVKCGTFSISELRSKFNGSKDVRNIFSYFGLNSSVINSASYKNGYVKKDGTVVVGGKVVATGASTAGRQNIKPSTKKSVGGTTFYTRSTSTSFRSAQLAAFVFFNKDGTYAGAVVKDCGNPVNGTNKVPKPKPAPKKIKVCDLKSGKVVTINEKDFSKSKHSKDLKDCDNIKVCDLKTKKVVTIKKHQYDKSKHSTNLKDCEEKPVPPKHPGVSINKTVDGVEHKQVAVDQQYNYELVVKNTGDVDLTNVKVSDPAPNNVQFISADKGTVANNQWSYTIPTLKVGQSERFVITAKVTKEVAETLKNTACVDAPQVPGNPDDCDDATVEVPPKPEQIKVCEIETKEVKTIDKADYDENKYTTDLSKCDTPETPQAPVKPETPAPQTPAELPQTGASDIISAGLGLGAVIAAASYYVASRRLLG